VPIFVPLLWRYVLAVQQRKFGQLAQPVRATES
jgi:hypothetical protein